MSKPRYATELMVKVLLEMKGMVYLAAERLGCHPDTIYDRAKKFKKVQDAIDCERGKLLDTAELKLYKGVMDGEHNGPYKWHSRRLVSISGYYVEKNDLNLKNLTTDELELFHKLYIKAAGGSA